MTNIYTLWDRTCLQKKILQYKI